MGIFLKMRQKGAPSFCPRRTPIRDKKFRFLSLSNDEKSIEEKHAKNVHFSPTNSISRGRFPRPISHSPSFLLAVCDLIGKVARGRKNWTGIEVLLTAQARARSWRRRTWKSGEVDWKSFFVRGKWNQNSIGKKATTIVEKSSAFSFVFYSHYLFSWGGGFWFFA